MSVVLLTNNSDRGQVLAHLMLASGIDLSLVVVEDPLIAKAGSDTFRNGIRIGLGGVYRWARELITLNSQERSALRFEEICKQKAEQRVQEFISTLGFRGRPSDVEYLETASLNEANVITAISNKQPDLCIVLGTSIIKPRIISIPKLGIINAHTSILPEYRGARSEFWQCYNQDYSHVGLTFHLVDAGVDTGRVLLQVKQDLPDIPEPNILRAQNTILMLRNYVSVVESVLNGTAKPYEQGIGSTPTYRFRDITLEKRLKLYGRIQNEQALG